MKFEIQKASPEQADILTSIAFAAKRHWGYPESWIREWAPLLTITPETIARLDVWCVQRDGEIAGFCALSYAGDRAELEHLWVLPARMGQGIGQALLEHAIQIARARGCILLEIESDPNAAGFYERMGALPAGQHAGEVGGQPRVLPLMVINL